MLEKYTYEYTDTFGGDANYSWVKRGEVMAKNMNHAVRLTKTALDLNNVICKRDSIGDMVTLRPRCSCTIVFIQYAYIQ